MDQGILDSAVRIATENALNGTPVSQILWIPPTSASGDPDGNLVVYIGDPFTAGEALSQAIAEGFKEAELSE